MILQAQADPASLANLNDVVLPLPISMAPSAPGWILVGVAVLVAAAVLAVRLVRRHRALRYRREALVEFQDLRAREAFDALPSLLKRVALSTHSRREVASLSGEGWTRFLDRSGGGGRFARQAGAELAAVAYRGETPERPDELLAAAEAWIRAQGPAR